MHNHFVTQFCGRVLATILVAIAALLGSTQPAHALTGTETVLMMPNRDARAGEAVVVWGVTTQANGTSFVLDFGDGTPPQTGTVSDRSYIAFAHTYAAQRRYTATLVVGSDSATATIQVFNTNDATNPKPLSADFKRQLNINMAIQDSLRYLWYTQTNRTTNFPAGTTTYWSNSYTVADTAFAALAFQNHGYRLASDGSLPTGLYERFIVQRSLNYVVSQLSNQALTGRDSTLAGNPCVAFGPLSTPGKATGTLTIATGAGNTVTAAAGLGYTVGTRVRLTDATNGANYLEGEVTAANATSLTVNADVVAGSGTSSTWYVNAASVASTSSVTIGTGSKTFTGSGLAYATGARVRAYAASNSEAFVEGLVTMSGSGTVTINVDRKGGSGTIASWMVAEVGWSGADCVGLVAAGESAYTNPVALLPLAASGALRRVNTQASASGSMVGSTYGEILQRVVNAIVWGQNGTNQTTGRGGWHYYLTSPDNTLDGSTIGWVILGLLDAEAGGAQVPSFLRTEFRRGFFNAFNVDGTLDYSGDGNPNVTNAAGYSTRIGIGLQGLFFLGDDPSATVGLTSYERKVEQLRVSVVKQIQDYWNGGTSTTSGNKGVVYTMFNNFKGLKLSGIDRIAYGGTQPANGSTVVVNGVTFTFKSANATAATDVLIGGSLSATASNLLTKLNASTDAAITAASYELIGSTIVVTHKTAGVGGNSYTLDAGTVNARVSGAALSGGQAPLAASGSITIASTPADGATVTVNGVTFTFRTTASTSTEVAIGGTAAATASSLASALTTSASAAATYTANGATVTVAYNTTGTAGNAFTLASSSAAATISGATLTGGYAGRAAIGSFDVGAQLDWYADYQNWLTGWGAYSSSQQGAPTTTTGGYWNMGFSCCYANPNYSISTMFGALMLAPAALVLPDDAAFSTVGLLQYVTSGGTPGWYPSPDATKATVTNGSASTHTVRAHAQSATGSPVAAARVDFTILSGPNVGLTYSDTTDADGNVEWTYTYQGPFGSSGTDRIRATIGAAGSNIVNMIWTTTPGSAATIGGAVTGLPSGTVLALLNNGSDTLNITGDGSASQSFTFPTTVGAGRTYAVTLDGVPNNYACTITGGDTAASGTITLGSTPADGATIVVNGVTFTFRTSASLATEVEVGVSAAAAANNLAIKLAASTNAALTGAAYSVKDATVIVAYGTAGTAGNAFTLGAGTSGATLSGVTLTGGRADTGNGSGRVRLDGSNNAVNVTSIAVDCLVSSFTLSGTVSGLGTGKALVLTNTVTSGASTVSTDNKAVALNGSFSFFTSVGRGNDFAVTVSTQPSGQVCRVTSGATGTNVQAQPASVVVTCLDLSLAKNLPNGVTEPQSATVNTAVASPPRVLVTDSSASPVAGVTVTFAVASGSGSLSSATVSTDSNGVAALTSWTLGTVAGTSNNSVTATTAGPSGNLTVTFTASGLPGAASKLVLNQPADIVAGGTRAAYTVKRQDQYSNDTTLGGDQTVYLFANGSGGTFYDAANAGNVITSVVIANGQSSATFWYTSNIAASYQITAADTSPATPDTGLTNATDTIVVTHAAASALAFSTQPGNGTGGSNLATQPAVVVRDQFGNTVANSTASITISLTSAAGAVLSCTTNPLSASSGTATFANCKVDKIGTYTLTAASGVLTSATSNQFTITVGAAAKLAFTTQPGGGTGGTAWGTQPVVSVQDLGGNTVTGSSASVALAIVNNPSSGTLSCTTSPLAASAGLATFAGCKIDKAGTGYTLSASSAGLTSATSSAFNITVGSPARLAYSSQPSGGTGGVAWATQPVVLIQDAGGNTVTTDTSSVTLAITNGTGTGGAALSCTANPRAAVAGQATFAGCTIDKAGNGYTLTATNGTLTSAISAAFNVTVGASAKLVFTTEPGGGTGGTAWAQQPVVTVQDAGGNTVTGSSASVTLTIGTNPGAGALTCTSNPQSASSGVVTFAGCKIDKVGTGYTLTASSNSVTSAVSAAFNIGSGSGTHLVFSTQPVGGTPTASTWQTQPVVSVRDAGGNLSTSSTAPVTLALTAANGASFSCTSNPVNAVGGIATFAGCRINKSGTYTLTATSPSMTSAVSSTVTIYVGPPASITIVTGDNQRARSGTAVPVAPSVVVKDAFGLEVSDVGVAFTVNSGGGQVSGGTQATNGTGVATVGGWTLGAEGVNTLKATVTTNGDSLTGTFVTFTAQSWAPDPVKITTPSLPHGVVGVKYGFELRARGGMLPYGFAVTSGALPGGVTLRSTGNFEGSPTAAGTYTFTVTVTDALGASTSLGYSVSVNASLAISTAFLSEGLVGAAYRSAQEVLGGALPFVWSLASGSLPAGLVLNPASGEITGTPAGAGVTDLSLRVTDKLGKTATKAFTLKVNQPTATVPVGNQTLFTLVGGQSSNGQSCPATTSVTVFPSNQAPAPPSTVASVPYGLVAYDVTICPGGSAEIMLVYPDTLPRKAQFWKYGRTPDNVTNHWYVLPGVIISGNTARFTVRDGGLGDDDLTVDGRIVDPAGIGLSALDLTGTAPDGTAGTAYSGSLAATGGTGPYVWSVSAGNLPPGLALAATSTPAGTATNGLTGTPTAAGTFGFTVQVIDESGTNLVAAKAFTVNVGAAGGATYTVTPVVAPAQGGSITPATAQSAAAGTLKIFQVTTNPGYTVSGASGCGGSLVGTQYTTDTITGNCSVNVTFTALAAGQTAQSITFPVVADQFFGAGPVVLAATASSGLPVQYEVSGRCVLIDASTVALTAAGSCTVVASQPGNASYAAAAPVTRSFQIASSSSPGAPMAAGLTLTRVSNSAPGEAAPSGEKAAKNGFTIFAGDPLQYTVTRVDAQGNPVGGEYLRVYLTVSCPTGYFTDLLNNRTYWIAIDAGRSSAGFKFEATADGVCTITASETSPPNGAVGLLDATDQVTVSTANRIPTLSELALALLALMLAAFGLRRRASFTSAPAA